MYGSKLAPGADFGRSLPCRVSFLSFVPQDDTISSDLTVYENLMYSAQLRLPREWSFEHKHKVVTDTIHLLGLDAVQHTVVGNVEDRGISGGQRKRVNIGLELVACPSLLFMVTWHCEVWPCFRFLEIPSLIFDLFFLFLLLLLFRTSPPPVSTQPVRSKC